MLTYIDSFLKYAIFSLLTNRYVINYEILEK